MLLLITYDVNTENEAGKKRLRKVAKQCENYGRRVQNSVFECIVDQAQSVMLKSLLMDIIDDKVDSLRFYYSQVRVPSIHKITGRLAPEKINKFECAFA